MIVHHKSVMLNSDVKKRLLVGSTIQL
uniref:Uncharacterized protein n=1 Tax=Tetranychus urticae TaxID=32264 RepID=T1KR75_TETUR